MSESKSSPSFDIPKFSNLIKSSQLKIHNQITKICNLIDINDAISDFIDLKNRSSAIGVENASGGLTLFEKSPKNGLRVKILLPN